jgi:Arc/MetJ family transcription regulator
MLHARSRLTRMHGLCIIMHMRTTMNLDDELLARAIAVTGIREKTAVVHEGLRTLISREAGRRLAALGGTDPRARAAPRRRPRKTR